MKELIPILNRVQDAVSSVNLGVDIDLPQIAVVGGQSSGKSSILEALVGRAFLPTGTGVVTRRPLVLRLCSTAGSSSEKEWGEFNHLPGQQFEDFNDIRNEIARDTERVCGSKQVVANVPIVLRIFSPLVIDLTLVDLPGITRVPIGDQPLDIEDQIRNMVMEYVSKPNCLILAVVAGNADLATADALAVARSVDPEGNRTVGVVTKLDIVDNGVDLLPVLEGRVYNLKQGFVGVVCRSYRDVQEEKPLRDQRQTEEQFFRMHPKYKVISNHCGISYLEKYLNKILLSRICETFPVIRREVAQMIQEAEAELVGYGEDLRLQKGEQGVLLLSLFTKFAGRFSDGVEGKISHENERIPGQLVGRARIDFIFKDIFARTVSGFNCHASLSESEIRVAIQNATGPRATLFVPEAAFELLVKRQISKLEAPSLQCAELAFEELHRVLLMSELPEFRRFLNLRQQIFGVVTGILHSCLQPAIKMIKNLIKIELAYINTSHPDFVGMAVAMRSEANSRKMGHSPTAPTPGSAAAGVIGRRSSVPTGAQPPLQGPDDASGGQVELLGAPPRHWQLIVHSGIFSSLGIFRGGNNTPGRPRLNSSGNEVSAEDGGGLLQDWQQASHRQGAVTLGGLTASGPRRAATSAYAGCRLPQIPNAILPAQASPTARERVEVDIIRTLLSNYLEMVKKNIADSVPKVVTHFMINGAKDTIQRECVAQLYKEALFDTLLQEATDVAGKRLRCRERLEALTKVMRVFDEVRDMDL